MDKSRTGKGERWDRVRAAIGRSVWLAMGILAPGVLMAACTTISGRHTFVAPTGIAPGDVIAVVLDRFSGEYSPGQEEKAAKCISEAIRETEPTVRIVPPEEFRRVAFPDLTPAQLPAGKQQWIDLALDTTFRDRIAPLDIRYLIVVEGGTEQYLKYNPELPAPGSAAVLQGDRWSQYSATMVDLKRPANVREVYGAARGKAILPFIPPIPIIPPTERLACNALGEEVAKFLVREKPPAETAGEQPTTESAKPPAQENRSQSEQQQSPRQ